MPTTATPSFMRMRILAAAVALCGLALPSAADLPSSLDRAPKDALLTITIPSLARFKADMELVGGVLGFDLTDLDLPVDIFALDGLKADGAATFAAIAGPEFNPEFDSPDFLAIIPVTDYAAFIAGLGGEGEPVASFTIDWQTMHVKNLGGGYAVIGDSDDVVRAFAGTPGNLAAHRAAIGPAGLAVAEASDLFITINLPAMRPMIDQMLDGMGEQFDMMAMMTGQDMAAPLAFFQGIGTALSRDGQALVIGLDGGDHGLTLGMTAQFAEGSPTAKYFAADGKASSLLAKLPAGTPFLAAIAMDFSAPGISSMLKEFAQAAQAPGGQVGAGMLGGLNLEQLLSASQGQAFFLGKPPALGGGLLFNNTLAYYPSTDPANLQKVTREALMALNGQTVEGMTYSTTYNPGTATIAGTRVDEWSLRTRFDPNNPTAAQAQQVMAFIFGLAGGPSGYSAAVPGGVVTTLAKNSALMETAIAAAKGQGPTLGGDPSIVPIAARLPAGRLVEGYLGTHAVLEIALEAGAMFGGFFDIELPAQIAPIGLGVTAKQGGMHLGVVVPMDALKAFKKIGDAMNADMDADDFDGGMPPPPPGRF